MKRLILLIGVMAASCSLFAQEPVITYRTTSSNPAYVIPDPIRVSYETSYPDAVLVTTWEPMGEWWHATYKGDNRITHIYYPSTVYYLEHPVSYRVALPVFNTYVPEEVVTSAINLYGMKLYSITRLRSAADKEFYQVRLLENNTSKDVWLDAQGVVMSDEDVNKIKMKMDDDKTKVKVDNQY